MQKALDAFVDAEKDFGDALTKVEAAQKKENNKAIDAMLQRAHLTAEFELAANQIDQACTYEALNKNGEVRGKMIDKAIKSLDAIYEGGKDMKNMSIPWVARACAAAATLRSARSRKPRRTSPPAKARTRSNHPIPRPAGARPCSSTSWCRSSTPMKSP